MLKPIRISLAVYILFVAVISLISIIQGFGAPKTTALGLLSTIGLIIPLLINFFYFYASYVLIKSIHEKYYAVLGFFIMQLIISLAIASSGYPITKFESSILMAIVVYGLPILLLYVLIQPLHKHKKAKSVSAARSSLGEHIKHLTDDELHELLN